MAQKTDRPGDNFVDLGKQGLSQGGNLSKFVDRHFESGNEVYIPPGRYYFDGNVLDGSYGNATLRGDSAGVVVDRPDPEERVDFTMTADSGDILLENITIRGKKGRPRTRWKMRPVGGDITADNLNWPDGTVDGSDSQAFFGGGDSGQTFTMRNCYFGPHGNSIAYFTWGNSHLVVDNCTMMNSNGMVRPNTSGATVRNCKVFGDGNVPNFYDGGVNEMGGARNRFIKIDDDLSGSTEVNIRNCHFYQTLGCSHPGQFIDNDESIGYGTIDGLYLYNETDASVTEGDMSEFSASNVHISGPGNTDIPLPDSGNKMPDTTKTVWTPNGTVPGGGNGYERPDHTLTLKQTSNPQDVSYSFTTTGKIVPGREADTRDDDSVTQNADGTWTASGSTGKGYADSWRFDGGLSSWQLSDSSAVVWEFDGTELSPAEIQARTSSPSTASLGNVGPILALGLAGAALRRYREGR